MEMLTHANTGDYSEAWRGRAYGPGTRPGFVQPSWRFKDHLMSDPIRIFAFSRAAPRQERF